jgi:ferredoxin
MPNHQAYTDLIEHMRNWIFGLPESDILLPLLELRFTPEEAAFLARFPHMPHTLEQLSEKLGILPDRLSEMMQPMIRKGLIYEVEGRSAVRYSFPDHIFSLMRAPGWRGQDDETNRRLWPLMNQYYIDHLGADYMGYPTKGLRAIPIAKTVQDPRKVTPYEDVLRFVDQEDYHTVSVCPCRHARRLDPDMPRCEHETMNCLHFGKLGRYVVKQGMGKKIRKEETFEILERAADAGLVHGISNSLTNPDTICNCCSCCCIHLVRVKMPEPVPRGHQPSNYRVVQNRETCVACGKCVELCPMDALALRDKADAPKPEAGRTLKPKDLKEIVYDPDRCIGCGVCVHKCPTQSLRLERVDEEQDYPESMGDAGRRMLTERGRNFSKVY